MHMDGISGWEEMEFGESDWQYCAVSWIASWSNFI